VSGGFAGRPRLAGREVYVKKVGQAVVLLPISGAWDSLTESLTRFTPDFMTERRQPALQIREPLD